MRKKVRELLDTIDFAADELKNLTRELRQVMKTSNDLEKAKIRRRLRHAHSFDRHAAGQS